MEKMVEKIEVGLHAQASLAEVSENGDMQDSIGGQMMQLYLPIIRIPLKKSEVGMARPCSTKGWNRTISFVPS